MNAEEFGGDSIPRFDRGRAVAINLIVALSSSLLMLYLEHALRAWPREASSMLPYWLIAPFLLAPPLMAVVALAFGARTSLAAVGLPWRPAALAALAAAFLLALATGADYVIALAAVLGI